MEPCSCDIKFNFFFLSPKACQNLVSEHVEVWTRKHASPKCPVDKACNRRGEHYNIYMGSWYSSILVLKEVSYGTFNGQGF